MKKIINGKLYDTETATYLGGWCSNVPRSDFSYLEESLYQKRSGEFFLFGCGMAATRYAKGDGCGNYGYGEKIIPLTWDAARDWAEERLSADKYEEVFGPVSEDDTRTTITLSLSVGSVEKAKRSAAQAGMSLSAYIESLI